jgi:hypothetical protein
VGSGGQFLGIRERFAGTIRDAGNTVDGVWESANDGAHWEKSMDLTYARV